MNPANTNNLQNKTKLCHVVAVPYPGRGHVNPMLNLCKLLASENHYHDNLVITITFVVTQEWLGFIQPYVKSNNIRLCSIPNVLPSELVRGADFPAFYDAVMTKMEGPFLDLIDELDVPVTAIIADCELPWAVRVSNARNIPIASLCTVSATVFSVFQHFFHLPDLKMLVDILDHGDDVEQIQGISSEYVAELQAIFPIQDRPVMQRTLEGYSSSAKSQYLLINTVQELEPQVIDILKQKLNFPIYPIGPAIPFFELEHNSSTPTSTPPDPPDYIQWLNSQPSGSVLYVSLGSFVQISINQLEEIASGLRNSGVRYLWVARGEALQFKESCGGKGKVVSWCDQLRVLCHSSVGGFLTHCGWNSTLEAVFSGVPMLTFPLFFDQPHNCDQIVEKWRIGRKMKKGDGEERKGMVSGEEVAEAVKHFMCVDDNYKEGKDVRRQAEELEGMCRQAIVKNGSSYENLADFINEIFGK